jgi:hypothetical protein
LKPKRNTSEIEICEICVHVSRFISHIHAYYGCHFEETKQIYSMFMHGGPYFDKKT